MQRFLLAVCEKKQGEWSVLFQKPPGQNNRDDDNSESSVTLTPHQREETGASQAEVRPALISSFAVGGLDVADGNTTSAEADLMALGIAGLVQARRRQTSIANSVAAILLSLTGPAFWLYVYLAAN